MRVLKLRNNSEGVKTRNAGRTRGQGGLGETLKEHNRKRVPLDWAINQNNLGNALARLGEREAGSYRGQERAACGINTSLP